ALREPAPAQEQTAKLQAPPVAAAPRPFTNNSMSPGTAIDQAARAALSNRGSYGGDNGDFGLGQGRQPAQLGPLDIISDTRGVDFGPYLSRVLHDVRENW